LFSVEEDDDREREGGVEVDVAAEEDILGEDAVMAAVIDAAAATEAADTTAAEGPEKSAAETVAAVGIGFDGVVEVMVNDLMVALGVDMVAVVEEEEDGVRRVGVTIRGESTATITWLGLEIVGRRVATILAFSAFVFTHGGRR